MILIHISKKMVKNYLLVLIGFLEITVDWPTPVNFNILAQETSTMGINAVICISCMLQEREKMIPYGMFLWKLKITNSWGKATKEAPYHSPDNVYNLYIYNGFCEERRTHRDHGSEQPDWTIDSKNWPEYPMRNVARIIFYGITMSP